MLKNLLTMPKFLKITIAVLAFIGILLYSFMIYTKSHSPGATAIYGANGLEISVKYCQPAKKGRQIFGGIVPYGEVWRTGANEATIISINKDVSVAGKPLKAGVYSLWTIPNQADFDVIFNSETGQWGTNHDPKLDVLKVKVPAQSQGNVVENFLIDFPKSDSVVTMRLNWDQTQISVPFK